MLNRRQILSGIGAGFVSGCTTTAYRQPERLVTPPRLRAGQTMGLIAPGGVVTAAQIARSEDNLRSLGFVVKHASNLLAQWGGYAGTIEQRVDAFHKIYFDDSVAGLWAVRGGSGTFGLLPHLNYNAIRANPKAVIGYSDITALHMALLAKAGMVSYHGPVASSTFTTASVEAIKTVLMDNAGSVQLQLLAQHSAQYRTIHSGTASGQLIGGNLSLVCALIGTGYLPALEGCILMLEDVGEAPYKVDRLLQQLLLHCPAEKLAAIALGLFTKAEPSDADPSLTLAQVLDHHFAALSVPAGYGFSFGHVSPQWVLPIGAQVQVQFSNGAIELL